jgi:transposase
VEVINQKLGVDNREKITAGQVIKALILNGLGMVSRPLYLFSQFFEDKAIEKLNRTGINSEYLNDQDLRSTAIYGAKNYHFQDIATIRSVVA